MANNKPTLAALLKRAQTTKETFEKAKEACGKAKALYDEALNEARSALAEQEAKLEKKGE